MLWDRKIPDFREISNESQKWKGEKFTKNYEKNPSSSRFEYNLLLGKVWRTGQWAVDKNLYPADKYPTYCNGPCYLMPSLTASRLHDLVSVTPSDLQADDAFISGVLRSKAAIPLIQYQRNASPGFCRELNTRKPRLPRRMRREFDRR